MRAAQPTLLKHAHRMAEISKHQQYHEEIAAELDRELIERSVHNDALWDAAWATLTTDAERDGFVARVAAINPDFVQEIGERELLRAEAEAEGC